MQGEDRGEPRPGAGLEPGWSLPQVGGIEGRYELLEPIGSGGMGEVWRAHDRRLRRFVAVKGLLDRNAMTAETQAAAISGPAGRRRRSPRSSTRTW
ncbi:hypothetical protein SCYAM73S_01377 [Streptomyces cyaneofuscatus]